MHLNSKLLFALKPLFPFLLFFYSLNSAATLSGPDHILIDPGHGGRDVGAHVGSYKESEIVWKWALALKRSLTEKGFKVSLSRNEMGSLPLEARLNKTKSDLYDFVISLHANYLNDPRVKGVEYFVLGPLSLEDQNLLLAHEETQLAHKMTAKAPKAQDSMGLLDKEAQITTIINDLKKQARIKKSLAMAKLLQLEWRGKLKQGPFDILNQAQAPAVLVELGFLSSPIDQKNLTEPHFINQHSARIAQVIANFFAQHQKMELNH